MVVMIVWYLFTVAVQSVDYGVEKYGHGQLQSAKRTKKNTSFSEVKRKKHTHFVQCSMLKMIIGLMKRFQEPWRIYNTFDGQKLYFFLSLFFLFIPISVWMQIWFLIDFTFVRVPTIPEDYTNLLSLVFFLFDSAFFLSSLR